MLCTALVAKTQIAITVADELNNFYSISELQSYRSNTYSAQVSSYDTTGGNNDGGKGKHKSQVGNHHLLLINKK